MLRDGVPTTLGALVGASTFAAGFLSTRVHRQRDRAVGLAQQMDSYVEETATVGQPVEPGTLLAVYRALNEAANDRLNMVAMAVVATLSLAVVLLALAQHPEVGWSSSDGWLLLAFMIAAVVVLAASAVDLLVARREVRIRRLGSIPGLLDEADRLLLDSRRWTGQSSSAPRPPPCAGRAVTPSSVAPSP